MPWRRRHGVRRYTTPHRILIILRNNLLLQMPTAFLWSPAQLTPGLERRLPFQRHRQPLPSPTEAGTGMACAWPVYSHGSRPEYVMRHSPTAQRNRFLRLLFTSKAWRDEHVNLLHGLTKKPEAIEATIRPNQLPPSEEARLIFNL